MFKASHDLSHAQHHCLIFRITLFSFLTELNWIYWVKWLQSVVASSNRGSAQFLLTSSLCLFRLHVLSWKFQYQNNKRKKFSSKLLCANTERKEKIMKFKRLFLKLLVTRLTKIWFIIELAVESRQMCWLFTLSPFKVEQSQSEQHLWVWLFILSKSIQQVTLKLNEYDDGARIIIKTKSELILNKILFTLVFQFLF